VTSVLSSSLATIPLSTRPSSSVIQTEWNYVFRRGSGRSVGVTAAKSPHETGQTNPEHCICARLGYWDQISVDRDEGVIPRN